MLFSASETALTSLGRLEVESILAKGGRRAKMIQSWLKDPNKALITVLVGNNIVNTAASSVFTLWVSKAYPLSISWLVGLFTLVLIVFSEILPKLWARVYGVKVAPLAMTFLKFVALLLSPVIFVFQGLSKGIATLSGMPGRDMRTPISEEELTHTIEIATKEGGIDRETGLALSNLIDFSDRLARDVMTPRSRVQAVQISWTQDEVLRFIARDGHSRYPVMRDSLDNLIGVILVKDLLAHIQKGNAGSWTRAIRRPYFVAEMGMLGNILRDMKRWGTHLALVRNETGVLTGLLTLEDVIEEIVGEIRDEHDDPAEAGSDRALGGPLVVSGDMPILDFNERFKYSLPMDVTYSTLNGYLLSRLGGQMPGVGTLIVDHDLTFRIHSVSESGIVTLEIIEHVSGNES